MGKFIDDKEFISNNVKELTKNMESQYAIFTPGTPTFTDYFYINKEASHVDSGLKTVEKLTGELSATRYNLIKDFPLFNMEQILLELEDTEYGLDSSYESEALILPNTIKPTPDDYFAISYLGKTIFFRVTDVKYDTLKNNNYYNISFTIKATDDSYYKAFMKNVIETYRCLYRNYGTENKFLVKEEILINVIKIQNLYEDLCKNYKLNFYLEKFNAFIYKGHILGNIYDPYNNHFINKNRLYAYNPNDINNMYFYEEKDEFFELDYDQNSIYSIMENTDKTSFSDESVKLYYGVKQPFVDSIFRYYDDDRVKSLYVSFPKDIYNNEDALPLLPQNIIDNIINNTSIEGDLINNILVSHFNTSIKDLEVLLNDTKKIKVNYTFEHYIIIPLVLFTIKEFIDFVLKNEQVS